MRIFFLFTSFVLSQKNESCDQNICMEMRILPIYIFHEMSLLAVRMCLRKRKTAFCVPANFKVKRSIHQNNHLAYANEHPEKQDLEIKTPKTEEKRTWLSPGSVGSSQRRLEMASCWPLLFSFLDLSFNSNIATRKLKNSFKAGRVDDVYERQRPEEELKNMMESN